MEFAAPSLAASFDPADGPLVSCWTAERIQRDLSPAQRAEFAAVLQRWGEASAAAQRLAVPLTDLPRLLANSGQRLYVAAQRRGKDRLVLFGGLKVGEKQLYLYLPPTASSGNPAGCTGTTAAAAWARRGGPAGLQQQAQLQPTPVQPTCVLDFHVATGAQRGGWGARLFAAFLAAEGAAPAELAYDRPSPACLAFLARHWGLARPLRHPCNYVTFPGFSSGCGAAAASVRADTAAPRPSLACGQEHRAAEAGTPPPLPRVASCHRRSCSGGSGSALTASSRASSSAGSAGWAAEYDWSGGDAGQPRRSPPARFLARVAGAAAAAAERERGARAPPGAAGQQRGSSSAGVAACLTWA